jgi:hypothetical protein
MSFSEKKKSLPSAWEAKFGERKKSFALGLFAFALGLFANIAFYAGRIVFLSKKVRINQARK